MKHLLSLCAYVFTLAGPAAAQLSSDAYSYFLVGAGLNIEVLAAAGVCGTDAARLRQAIAEPSDEASAFESAVHAQAVARANFQQVAASGAQSSDAGWTAALRDAHTAWLQQNREVSDALVDLRSRGTAILPQQVQARLSRALNVRTSLSPDLAVVAWTDAELSNLAEAVSIVRRVRGRPNLSNEAIQADQLLTVARLGPEATAARARIASCADEVRAAMQPS